MIDANYRDKQLSQLQHFFATAKRDSLTALSPDTLAEMRSRIRETINDLLIWGRPHLAATRGIQWPYHECSLIAPHLAKVYCQDTDKKAQQQALLFLALLPVPNQWRWLAKAIDILPDEPEIKLFLTTERQTIQSKLTGRGQSSLKLRHVMQILKSPQLPHEKGVLRIFSLPYLFLDKQLLRKIANNYVFFLEPPMGVVFRHAWWRAFTELEDPCIFGLGGEEDRFFIDMQANTHVIRLAHGDFLPDLAPLDPAPVKDIDIVFNGTFDDMARKRHFFMLELLHDPRLKNKKALFLGRGSQENITAFKKEVERHELTDRVTVLSNLRRQDIPRSLGRCRIGVHLSLYENSCRCIYEYYRANIPCVISSATAGMDMRIFNQKTGRVADDAQLPEIIASMIHQHSSFTPRQWFQNNSGSLHSSRKLNEELMDFFTVNGYLWNSDIVPLDSSGANRYLKKEHYRHFLPEFHQLLSWLQPSMPAGIKLTVDG
ncbi:glycosyltransferase [Desulfopila sp. IMCC35006]|uniref:glycosyltransferase n=1 Tax=Desulfopila sp. IMCC35006 TaxID=2569542 RepID=UPI0010AC6E91|nr:glycosyltransferase [Desulfopila sp. IMCC35006]TKB23799.1 glycosyltransferase [Desulfopila sp. IMCC35006]